MKIKSLAVLILIVLNGCSHYYTGSIDATPLASDKATLIIYPNLSGRKHNKGVPDDLPVNMDGKQLGIVSTDKPLKVAIEPGEHKFYVETHVAFGTREITTQNFEKNTVSYMRLWLDSGFFVAHFRIDPSPPVSMYSSLTYSK